VARKLKVADFETWIQGELNGYTKLADAPEYRVIRGTCEAFNPYHGWQTVHFADQKSSESVTLRPITNPIGSLSELVAGANSNKASLTMQMPAGITNKLMKEVGFGITDIHLRFQVADFANVIETVKTKVLEWSLQLEEAGVLGEGMNFSPEEQTAAKTAAVAPTYQATNMTVVHSMAQSQIQQASPGATQAFTMKTVDVEELVEFVKAVRAIEDQLPEQDKKQANADLATLEAQAEAPTPSRGIVLEAAASLRKILESAAGSLTATTLPPLIQKAHGLIASLM
jgi:pyruvate/2-oxoglutarate dehydrogenase complex dihydrolipoamide acyltransferase (E2) component